MSETKSKTKAELQAALDERDMQIVGLRSEIDAYQEEILARVEHAIDLEGAVGNLSAAVLESASIEARLRAEVDTAREDTEVEAEFGDAVEAELATTVEDLFSRLVFVSQSLGAVVSYRGANIETIQNIAEAVYDEVFPLVEEGCDNDHYTAEGAIGHASCLALRNLIQKGLEVEDEIEDEINSAPGHGLTLEAQHECCGGGC